MSKPNKTKAERTGRSVKATPFSQLKREEWRGPMVASDCRWNGEPLYKFEKRRHT